MLFEKDNCSIKDKIMRSYGILLYAEKIDVKEAMQLLSIIRLGVDMGIITSISIDKINEIIMNIHTAILKNNIDVDENNENIDQKRAEYIKNLLR
jgi:protein arginine kinase